MTKITLIIILILFFVVACGETTAVDEQADLVASELAELEEVAVVEREEVVDVVQEQTVSQEETTISIRFVESAPKDRFVFENMGSCVLGESTVEIDLAQTAGKLIFDTTASGEGVEVFQPFEILEGDVALLSSERVSDGDIALTIQIGSLAEGSRAGFTIDVDDSLTDSDLGMIRVTDSEMSGGVIRITHGNSETVEAIFDDVSRALVTIPCGGS